jgi:hypothetical protein
MSIGHGISFLLDSRFVNNGLFQLRQLFFSQFDIEVHTNQGKLRSQRSAFALLTGTLSSQTSLTTPHSGTNDGRKSHWSSRTIQHPVKARLRISRVGTMQGTTGMLEFLHNLLIHSMTEPFVQIHVCARVRCRHVCDCVPGRPAQSRSWCAVPRQDSATRWEQGRD